jgi:hypothetical protein
MSQTKRRGRPPGRIFPHQFQVALDDNCDAVVRGIIAAHPGCTQNEAVRMVLRAAAARPPGQEHRDRAKSNRIEIRRTR